MTHRDVSLDEQTRYLVLVTVHLSNGNQLVNYRMRSSMSKFFLVCAGLFLVCADVPPKAHSQGVPTFYKLASSLELPQT